MLIRIDSACLIGNRYAIIPKTVGSRVTVDVMNTIDYIVVSKLFENSANRLIILIQDPHHKLLYNEK